MSTLVIAALTVRKTARASLGFTAAVGFLALVALGVFRIPSSEIDWVHLGVLVGWTTLFAVRVTHRSRRTTSRHPRWLDLELGLMLLAAAHALVQLGGGLSSTAYPLVYVVIALVSSFSSLTTGLLLVAAAAAFEALLWWALEPTPHWGRYGLHVAFLTVFGALSALFMRAEIARVRQRSARELREDKERVREDALLYRLVSAPSSAPGSGSEEKIFRSSVEQVRNSVYHVLDLLRRTLRLHTCVLLMVDDTGRKLRIVELVTDCEDIAEGPFGAGEGAVGAAFSRGVVMRLENLKPGYKGICYYRDGSRVKSFVGMPVAEGGRTLGVLCVDRADPPALGVEEESILEAAVAEVQRAMQNERVFVQLERSKREQSHLYRASASLGEAMTEDQVLSAGLAAAENLAGYDFAAITHYDPGTRTHSVTRAVGSDAERFQGLRFRDNTSLTAMAVKNRHYLPYRGEFDAAQQTVFTRRTRLNGMKSLLVVPLVVREDAIGTLALATTRHGAFSGPLRETISVLANQLAVALSNAAAFRRLEEMATTDGLTGCLNKRAFLEELESKLRSAERFGRPLSLLVTDLDHFKSVNDTYGHHVGDQVIKGLGEILLGAKRETDSVARFGGEEFCILCEETDSAGAVRLAERVRQELKARIFQTEVGDLSVTCSIGVATFPQDAASPEELFKVSDEALYAAKRSGRDRVCTA